MKSGSKRLLVLAITVMLLTVFASCNVLKSIGQISPDKKLSEQELARLITEAVQSEASVNDSYSKIPESQLDGVSYTAFSEYVSILRSMSQKHGEVDSFRILGDEASEEYFDSIMEFNDNIKSFDSYGDLDVVELCYSDDQNKDLADASFVIKITDDGSYSLAGSYITDTILTYDFISHYFSMISIGNTDALSAILSPTYSSEIYIDSVINAKAEYIIDYYNLKVKSELADYEITCFTPVLVSYKIPKTIDSDGVSVVPHEVDLMVDKSGMFCLMDEIPVTYTEPVYLYSEGEKTLTCGSFYTYDSIKALLGEPLYTILPDSVDHTYTGSDDSVHDVYVVIVSYNGLILRFDAEYGVGSEGEWGGILTSALLYETTEPAPYSFNSDVTIGMNMAELLLINPVLDEYGFVYTYEEADSVYKLTPEFDENNNINKIRFSLETDT